VPKGAKSRMRRTETPKPIWIKFCMVVDIPDVVKYTNFGDHRLRGFWVAGVNFPLSHWLSSSPLRHSRTTMRACDVVNLNLVPNSVLKNPFYDFHSMFQQFDPSVRSTVHRVAFCFVDWQYDTWFQSSGMLPSFTKPLHKSNIHWFQYPQWLVSFVLHAPTI